VDDAPEVFELDSSGTSTLRLTETDDEKVLTAAAGCPMSAISVFDAGSGERVT
jgi:ferredoxin